MRTLVRLTKAVHMHQAVTYQNGPLAGRRQEILATRNEVETRIELQKTMKKTGRSEPTTPGPSGRRASSTSSEDYDEYDTIPTSITHEIGDESWTRKTLLTFGECEFETLPLKLRVLTSRTDGGGTRSYSSLLVLEALMIEIASQEQQYQRPTPNSMSPLLPRVVRKSRKESTDLPIHGPHGASSSFLPCHYFDYIAGTGSGG